MKLSDFNYHLPENLIAQKPTSPRDHCRLLVINRHCDPVGDCGQSGATREATKQSYFEHKKFFEIEKFLQKGDVLVLNDSKVIPARIFGKKDTGGSVEILLIKKISSDIWEAMLKNFKTKEFGKKIIISLSSPVSSTRASSRRRGSSKLSLRGTKQSFLATPAKNIGEGLWQIKFNLKGTKLDKAIHKYGQAPLPPYIKSSTKLADYQTIYAQKEGSIAAPTAGLHFTKQLINKLKKKGVIFEKITLHIGLGTFAPIREENIEKHKMHGEYTEIPAKTARTINKAREEGRRVIAVGTTSARTLEAFARQAPNSNLQTLSSGHKEVNIFIKPGYKFKIIDGMITNFHLPKTTLIILVSAFAERNKILRAYNEAINKKYRFFSFGDSMLII